MIVEQNFAGDTFDHVSDSYSLVSLDDPDEGNETPKFAKNSAKVEKFSDVSQQIQEFKCSKVQPTEESVDEASNDFQHEH